MKKIIATIISAIALLTIGASIVYAALPVTQPINGGTGTSTIPSFGSVLVGNSKGTYSLMATSSLNITGFETPPYNSPITIYASKFGCALNSNVVTGGGTDDTVCIQNALNLIAANPAGGTLIVDGVALISGANIKSSVHDPIIAGDQTSALMLGSSTTLKVAAGGGFFLAAHCDCVMLGNLITGAVGAVYQQNITVDGGIWNYNNPNQDFIGGNIFEKNLNTNITANSFWFGSVNNLTIKNVTLLQGANFQIELSNVSNVVFDNVVEDIQHHSVTNQDGLHMEGNISNLSVDNFTDNGNDDQLGLTTNEQYSWYAGPNSASYGKGRLPESGAANESNLVFNNIYFNAPASGVRFWSNCISGQPNPVLDNIVFRNITGSVSQFGMQNFDATVDMPNCIKFGTITFSDWNMTGPNGRIAVGSTASTNQNIRINNASFLSYDNSKGAPIIINGDGVTSINGVTANVTANTNATNTLINYVGNQNISVTNVSANNFKYLFGGGNSSSTIALSGITMPQTTQLFDPGFITASSTSGQIGATSDALQDVTTNNSYVPPTSIGPYINGGNDTYFLGDYGFATATQEIMVPATTTVSAIQLYLEPINSPLGGFNVSVYTNSQACTGTVFCPSGTLANANATSTQTPNNTTAGWTTFPFTPFTLSPNVSYWITANVPQQSLNTMRWEWDHTVETTIYGGGITGYLSGGSWNMNTGVAKFIMLFTIPPYAQPLYSWGTSTAPNLLQVSTTGNIGIGTTTPGSIFSIANLLNLTTATSSIYSQGGLNISNGCYAIAGTCLSTGGSSSYGDSNVNSYINASTTIPKTYTANTFTSKQTFSYASTTSITSSGSAYFGTAGGNVGIGTSSPYSMLSVAGQVVAQNFVATSTSNLTGTSTFAGNVMIGSSLFNGQLEDGGFFGSPTLFQASNNVNDLANAIVVGNTNPGIYAGSCMSYANDRSSNLTVLGGENYFAGTCFSSGEFNNAIFPGLPPNSLGTLVTDGAIVDAATSANAASSTFIWALGPGFSQGNYDMVLKNVSFDNVTNLANGGLGIGSSTPDARLSLNASTTATFPFIDVNTNTNGVQNASILKLLNNGNFGIGSSTPGTLLSIGNTGANAINLSPTATSTFGSGLNLTTGCYAIAGTCIGGSGGTGSGTVGSGTAGQNAFYQSNGTAVVGTSTIFTSIPAGLVGINNTSPLASLDVQDTNGATNIQNWRNVNGNIEMSVTAGGVIANNSNISAGTSISAGTFIKAATQMLTTANNTAAAPSYTNAGLAPSNTGMYFPANTTLGFSQAGIQAGVFGLNGMFGLGTSTPAAILSISATSTTDLRPLFMVATSTGTANTTVDEIDRFGNHLTGGTPPTLSSCGTSPSFIGPANNNAMIVQVGSVSATGCTITFANNGYVNTPEVNITNESMSVVNAMTYSVTPTVITISQTGLTGDILNISVTGTQ